MESAGSGGESLSRRDLLGRAVLGGAALVAASGCQQGPARGARDAWRGTLDREAADQLLASVDRRLEWIDKQTFPDTIVPLSKLAKLDGGPEEIARKTDLTRKAMRALYITGRFADLPDELKVHPGVQARLAETQSDMDDAIFGMTSILENMKDEEHRRVRDYLREHPDLGERIARYVEQPAVEDGVPAGRRREVRAGILELSRRMAAQSPSLVTDPIVRKVRRIKSRSPSEQSRLISARIGEQAFWAHQEKMASIYEAWLEELGPEGVMRATAGASAYLGGQIAGAPQVSAPPSMDFPPGEAGAPGAPGEASPRAASAVAPASTTPPATPAPSASAAPPAEPPPATAQTASPTVPYSGRPAPTNLDSSEPQRPLHQDPQPGRGARTVKSGAIVMGFGAGSIALGLIFFGLAAGNEGALFYLGMFFGVTVGPIAVIVGLIILIVGAIMSATEKA